MRNGRGGTKQNKMLQTAYRQVANKYGSRHSKSYAQGIKAKNGVYKKIGRLSHGVAPR